MIDGGTEGRPWQPPSVDRPVATFMVVAAVAVFGWVSLQRMPVDLMPELSYPTLTVRTDYVGAAPEEVEDAITRPIEELLGTVEGMIGLSSVSRAGSSDVILRFAWDTNLDGAIQKVRERIALVRLPTDVSAPTILRYDPTLDPIVTLAVVGGESPSALRDYVEHEVEPRLEEIPGVAMVRITGGDEGLVRVALSEARLSAYGIEVSTVADRLRNENVNVAGGQLFEGEVEYLVRTVNEFASLDDIRDVVVAVRPTGLVRVRDLATVTHAVREREVLTRVGGDESVEIAVYKDADANLVAVAAAVRERIFGTSAPAVAPAPPEEPPGLQAARARDTPLEEAAPDDVSFFTLTDQSQYIEAAIDEVSRTAVLGGLCAVLVLFGFLRRTYATFVVGLAIPLSVIATFAPMRLMDVSLNIMSLGGLALGIGMLVDNAVVVLESIVRCEEEGDDPRSAALRGTREVAGAVVASTLTTVAVFLPIVFVEGVAGQLFRDLGVAVVLSLLASLLFALLFVPMMAVLPSRLGADRSDVRGLARELFEFAALATARADLKTAIDGLRRSPLSVIWAAPLAIYAVVRLLFVGALELVSRAAALIALAAAFVAVRVVGLAAVAVSWVIRPALAAFAWGLATLTSTYRSALGLALRGRLLVALAAVLSMGWVAMTWPTLGMQLIPELRQGVFTAQLRLPVGTRIGETAAAVARVEERLVGEPDIARTSTFIGRREDHIDASEQGQHYAELTVTVAKGGDGPQAEDRAAAAVRAAAAMEPALLVELTRPTLFSLAAPIVVEVRGEQLDAIADTARRIEAVVDADPRLTDVRSSAREGFPEIRVVFHRERIAALGLDVRSVAEVVRAKVQGSRVTELRTGERSLDIEVAVERDDIADVAALRQIVVAFQREPGGGSPAVAVLGGDVAASMGGVSAGGGVGGERGRPITLSGVADIELSRGPAEIRRVDGQRAAVISAGTSVLDLDLAIRELGAALASVPIPEGQVVVVSGQSDELAQARTSLLFALVLAIFLVYVVMASKFESLAAPFVILFTVPLATVGVVAVLWLSRTPVSVVVFIGLIVLAGIVVNNAIVLVDYIIALRRRGMAKREAIINACAIRLRPVLITATTTILGLVPMAMGLGEGAEIRRPLAWVVIAGLTTGTLLTLVVIPVVYDLLSLRDRDELPRSVSNTEAATL